MIALCTEPETEIELDPVDVEIERGEPCTTLHVYARTRTKGAVGGTGMIRLGSGHVEVTLAEAEKLIARLTEALVIAHTEGLS